MNNTDGASRYAPSDVNKDDINNRSQFSVPNLAQQSSVSSSSSAQEQYQYNGPVPNINKYSPYNQSTQLQNTTTNNSYQLPSYQQQQYSFQPQQYALQQPQQYPLQQQLYQPPNNNGQLSRNGVDGFESNMYGRLAAISSFGSTNNNSNYNNSNSNSNNNNNNNYIQNNQYGQQQPSSDYNFISPSNNTQDTINTPDNNNYNNKTKNIQRNDNNNNNSPNFNYQVPDMMYAQYMNQLTNKSNNLPQQQQQQPQQQQMQQMQQQHPSQMAFNNMASNLPTLSNAQYANPQIYNITTNTKAQTNNIRTLQNLLDLNNLPPPQNSQIRNYQQGRQDKPILSSQEIGGPIQDANYSINNNPSKLSRPSLGDNNVDYIGNVAEGEYTNLISKGDPYYSNVFTNTSEQSGDRNSMSITEPKKQPKKLTKKKKKPPTSASKPSTKKSKKTDPSDEKDNEKKKKDKKKKKQGPKRPSSAYFLYFITMRKQLIADHPDAKVPEIAKIASVQWKNMSLEERKPYNDRFKVHWGEYLVAREAFKKTLPPKRPSGPFIKFTQDMRPKLTTEYPNKNLIEVTKLIGQKWKELTEEKRAVYKDAYKLELRAWEKTVGFKRQNENVESVNVNEDPIYAGTDDNHKVESSEDS